MSSPIKTSKAQQKMISVMIMLNNIMLHMKTCRDCRLIFSDILNHSKTDIPHWITDGVNS